MARSGQGGVAAVELRLDRLRRGLERSVDTEVDRYIRRAGWDPAVLANRR